MKKYIFLALLTMGVSSCQLVDVLDQKPEFEADLDGAITTPAAVELALNGIYYSLPGNGFNVIFPTVSGSFVSIRPRACFSPSYNKVKSQTKHVWLLTLL